MSHPSLPITVIVLLALALPIGAVAESEDVEQYLPFAKGAEWHYSIEKKASFSAEGRTTESNIVGSSWEQVTGVGEHPYGVMYVLKQDLAETDTSSGATMRASFQTIVTSEPGRILMHARKATGAGIDETEVHFDPPIAVLALPLPAEGEANPALLREGGLVIDARPFAKERETVRTDAGEFADCLKISAKGPISGQFRQGEVTVPVAEGYIEVTNWYGKDVGLVKQVQTRNMRVDLPNGGSAESHESYTKLLTKYVRP